MANVEKISIALPPEMLNTIRSAIDTGEYASNSEVVREALRDWIYKHRWRQKSIIDLSRLWEGAIRDDTNGISSDDIFNRLEEKYQVKSTMDKSQ